MNWKCWQKKDGKMWFVEHGQSEARIERTDKDGKLNYYLRVSKQDRVIDPKLPYVSAFITMKSVIEKDFKTLQAAQAAATKAMKGAK